jgi:uncharacterized repeat protein (TIGR03803 family)
MPPKLQLRFDYLVRVLRIPRRHIVRVLTIMIVAAATFAPNGAWARTYSVLHNFCVLPGCKDGYRPSALSIDAAGNLYGVTFNGGYQDQGILFRLKPNPGHKAWDFQRLHIFCAKDPSCPDGSLPYDARPLADTSGNIFGMTVNGGPAGNGVLYEYRNAKQSLHVLSNFEGQIKNPRGEKSAFAYNGQAFGLPYDGRAPLYATSVLDSGRPGEGVAFVVAPRGGKTAAKFIYAFCSRLNCSDGYSPVGGLGIDPNGNLFGVTRWGGDAGHGVIFELTKNSAGDWTESVLHAFCETTNCPDGDILLAGPVMDSAGNLYGTAYQGGSQNNGCCGTIYELTFDGSQWQFSVVYNFCSQRNCDDGSQPWASLLPGSDGKLYGTATVGGGNPNGDDGSGAGTAFALSGSSLDVIHHFCADRGCADGKYPIGALVEDGAGNLYGTASQGGTHNGGVVFEISP